MADYVNCPTCHGKGLIPLTDAEPITAHADATAQAAYEQKQADRRAIDQAVLDAIRNQQIEQAAEHQREIEALRGANTDLAGMSRRQLEREALRLRLRGITVAAERRLAEVEAALRGAVAS